MKVKRIGIFVTHPVQYHVPLWKRLNQIRDFDVSVYYFSDQGVSKTIDSGFGKAITWDVPLLEGYKYTFLTKAPIQKQNAFAIPKAHSFFNQHNFDAVFLHGYTQKFARQILSFRKKKKFKVLLHGEFTDMPRRPKGLKDLVRELYLRWFYHRVDHFSPIGKEAKDHLTKRNIPEKKITVTPYSVDSESIKYQKSVLDKKECRKSLGIKENQIAFVFSGKLIPRKQPLLLADAALSLKDDRIVLIYLGDGEQSEALKIKLQPEMKKRFIAPGFVNQSRLGRYFMAADVFVLPSFYDTWGLVVNEGMHYGLPCIVSDRVGSRRDLVFPGKTGDIFVHDDQQALARCMRRYLDEPGLTKKQGQNAAVLIKGFSIDVTARKLEQAFRVMLETQP